MGVLVAERIFDVPPLAQGVSWASDPLDVSEAASVAFACFPETVSTLAATAAIKFSDDNGVTWHAAGAGTSNSVKNQTTAIPAGTVARAFWAIGIAPAMLPLVRAEVLVVNAAGAGYDGGKFVLRAFKTSI